ncbi:MAG TPA: beta-propeller fold lactonase family protein [Acidobacteriaceae bacterium]|nr:beta-propeller fold lactonase family protein [Acidobacteriaceae bacterium]
MNLNSISRRTIRSLGRSTGIAALSAAMVLGLASCSLDYVVGYVYVTTAKSSPGLIDQYSIDFQSGALSSIGTPVKAGNNPVRILAAPNGQFVYVLNQGDSTVQEFAVQADGTLLSKNTYPLSGGTSPTALAFDPAGKFLYVAFTWQTGFSAGNPGPGGVAIFPVNADNSLGTQTTQPVGNNPVGVTASYFNHFVYVLDAEDSPKATVLGFSQNPSTGALTPVPGTVITTVAGKTVATGFPAGVAPSGIAEEQTARFLYVTDRLANQLIGYSVNSDGSLTAMINGPFPTGLYPTDVTIDPTGSLIYVVNFNANTVQGYQISPSTGTPSGSTGAFATKTGYGPTCVIVDPALGDFLYTTDQLDNTVTAERVTVNTGALAGVQNSPFPADGSPTCLTAVPNGSHATQIINP